MLLQSEKKIVLFTEAWESLMCFSKLPKCCFNYILKALSRVSRNHRNFKLKSLRVSNVNQNLFGNLKSKILYDKIIKFCQHTGRFQRAS